MWIFLRGKNTVATTNSAKPPKNKQQKGVAIIDENPNNSSWANVSKEEETCNSISSDDESEVNAHIWLRQKRIKINFGSYSLTTARLGNLTAINQEDEKSVGQYGGLDLDDTI